MNTEVIHIKLEHSEAIQGKRGTLTAEESLVRISKSVANYTPLRLEELSERTKMMKKVAELKNNLNKLEKTLPKVKVPRSLRKKVEEGILNPEIKSTELKKEVRNLSLEEELAEIQRKLKKIGA